MDKQQEQTAAPDLAAPGTVYDPTPWVCLTQAMLTEFEILTKSNDPLHMDPDWVVSNTDFPGTIAPGLLTLSLLPYFAAQLKLAPDSYVTLNYGFDRVRWMQPVPVNSKVRARFVLVELGPLSSRPGYLAKYDVTIEMADGSQPVMAARWLGAMLPAAGFRRL